MPKKYKIPEPEPSVVNEPSVSYGTGYTSQVSSEHYRHLISERKLKLIDRIVNEINDGEVLEELEQTVFELTHKKRLPCRFTPEELNSRAATAIEDYEEGEYMSHEEMKKMFF
ncbi:MAG: hypothetical protein LIP08_10160 [Bacteroides sp.]|nr:hypothetical protein [Bacteroides sp.]